MPVDEEALRQVPLLSALDKRDLRRLATNLKEQTVLAGDTLVTEGTGGVGFFIILEGKVKVISRGETQATLGPGDYLGELALIARDAVRTATVQAETDVRCARMAEWEFRPFVRENPDVAWQLLNTLANRLHAAERRLASS